MAVVNGEGLDYRYFDCAYLVSCCFFFLGLDGLDINLSSLRSVDRELVGRILLGMVSAGYLNLVAHLQK